MDYGAPSTGKSFSGLLVQRRRGKMKTRHLFTSMVALLVVGGLITAFSVPSAKAGSAENLEKFWVDTYGLSPTTADLNPELNIPNYEINLVAKAKPDECFTGLSSGLAALGKFLLTYPNNLDCKTCLDSGGRPKVNQAYVWGMTKHGPDVWFGTAANVLCLVLDGFLALDIAMETDSWVCEKGPDVRPPRLFIYHTKPATGQAALEDLTPIVLAKGDPDKTLLLSTYGIRSAGSHNGVIFFGGLNTSGKVVLFAFDAATKNYLGSRAYTNYTNIRQWIVAKKELYVGVATGGAGGFGGGGEILRWTGSVSDPFRFETVGVLTGDPAYLAEHKNRLFSSTWGGLTQETGSEGTVLYMSPLFNSDQKLTAADKDGWEIVWKLSDYEVEPTAFQVGGALHSYGAYLYWGTMQVPLMSLVLFWEQDIGNSSKLLADFLGTNRPICIFRGKNFGKNNTEVELLYGTSYLPKYNAQTSEWEIVPNNLHQKPKFGLAGFNNFFNNYTWWMDFYHGRLFVGTMDWSFLLSQGLETFAGVTIPPSIQKLAQHFYGADLYNFVSLDYPAIPVSLSGVGNYTNYGIRTMVSDDFLYLGTANPMNILTNPTGDKPLGGWELRKLRIKEGLPWLDLLLR
jgi:hypothetical protein